MQILQCLTRVKDSPVHLVNFSSVTDVQYLVVKEMVILQENISLTEGNSNLSYDVASGSEIMTCNKIDKPLVVYRFTGNVTTFRT